MIESEIQEKTKSVKSSNNLLTGEFINSLPELPDYDKYSVFRDLIKISVDQQPISFPQPSDSKFTL